MKKLFIIPFMICMVGCQPSQIKLPKGHKLIMATYKIGSICYLTEEMDSDYIPKTKVMRHLSIWGENERVIFTETK